jgi:ribosomal protein L11 methyltransferase
VTPATIVRLGIRVRGDRAELALARLLPLLQAGCEERAVENDVEYSLYAPAGELPRVAEIRSLAGDALVDVTREPVEPGWERRWHAFLRPVRVGPLAIRPPWVEGEPSDLVIDPGRYFGAGTHPTTRLCLALLLDERPGDALCDWGAGTGVLAIAAARLGYAPVTAVEVEAGALELISVNAAANGVAVTTRWLDLRAAAAPWAPTVTANLTRPLLLAAAETLQRPPRRLLASGVLREEVDDVVAAYRPLGLRERARREEGEWAAVALESVAPVADDVPDGDGRTTWRPA